MGLSFPFMQVKLMEMMTMMMTMTATHGALGLRCIKLPTGLFSIAAVAMSLCEALRQQQPLRHCPLPGTKVTGCLLTPIVSLPSGLSGISTRGVDLRSGDLVTGGLSWRSVMGQSGLQWDTPQMDIVYFYIKLTHLSSVPGFKNQAEPRAVFSVVRAMAAH